MRDKKNDSAVLQQMLKDYAKVSTVGGLVHFSLEGQPIFKQFFWGFVTAFFIAISVVWSYSVYNDWSSNPVLTTIKSPGLPIKNIDFPTVTICIQGSMKANSLENIFNETFFEFVQDICSHKNMTCKGQGSFDTVKNLALNSIGLDASFCTGKIWRDCVASAGTFLSNFFSNLPFMADFIDDSNINKEIDMETFTMTRMWRFSILLAFLRQSDIVSNTILHDVTDYTPFFLYTILMKRMRICNDDTTNFGRAMFRSCSFGSVKFPCAALFHETLTDTGVCCTTTNSDLLANIANSKLTNYARKIFKSNYTDTKVSWKSQPGINRGLKVELDANSDILEKFSIETMSRGFKIYIDDYNSFPLITQKSFIAGTGFHTLVSISAKKFETDVALKGLQVTDRNCMFDTEVQNLTLFEKYSQSNCFLECALNKSHDKLFKLKASTCTPWFFPPQDSNDTICVRTMANIFMNFMNSSKIVEQCSWCLPDCNGFKYSWTVTSEKVRKCDEKNFGVSKLCDPDNFATQPQPLLWANQALKQMPNIQNLLSSNRVIQEYAWHTGNTLYDAFDGDIASLSIFFRSPTALHFLNSSSQSWISYFSFVGGIFGLFIGLSIVTLYEWIWLLMKMVAFGLGVDDYHVLNNTKPSLARKVYLFMKAHKVFILSFFGIAIPSLAYISSVSYLAVTLRSLKAAFEN